tara:strand:+ start:200 stop:658 length:459 start_codon:yes stop_codon:yes gene_type:complete
MSNTKLARRKEIQAFEKSLIALADGDFIEGNGKDIVHSQKFPMKHTFADGVYVREMFMKKDSAVIGAIHKHLHVWFLMSGHLVIAKEESKEEYLAPCYVLAEPGSKRVIYAVEDSVFVNVHKNPTNTQDILELEKNIVALNREDYEKYLKNK